MDNSGLRKRRPFRWWRGGRQGTNRERASGTSRDDRQSSHDDNFDSQTSDEGEDLSPQELWQRRYGEMLLKVSWHLTKEYSVMLATYYNISSHHRQRIENSETPGLTLLHLLEERNVICQNDVSSLTVALGKIDLYAAAKLVFSYAKYVRRTRISDPPVEDPRDDSDDKLAIFVNELRHTYRKMFLARPIPWEKEMPLEDFYIKQELYYRGQKPNAEVKLSSYKDLLRQERWEETKRILMEGHVGMGKTTCMLKIARDWATGKKPIKNKRFVILLFLRNVEGETPLAQAVVDHLLPNDSKLFVSDVQRLLRKYECSCLLLLDGHDELRIGRLDIRQPKECATIQRVIEGAVFRNLAVWITSRPSDGGMTLPNISSYQTFSVEGFSTQNMGRFITKTFGSNEAASQAFLDYISSNPVLSDVCKAPLFLALLSQVQYDHISTSQGDTTDARGRNENLCDILLKLFTVMNAHFEKKFINGSHSIHEIAFQNQLGKIALDGLSKQGRLQLTWNKEEFLDEVDEEIYSIGRKMGVLLENTITRPIWESFRTYSEEQVTFSHQFYQEWLAASYVSSSVRSEDSIFAIVKNVDVVSNKNLLLFVCGMNEALAVWILKYLYINKLYYLLPECFFQCKTDVDLRSVPVIGVPIVEIELDGGNYLKEALIHFLANCSKSKISVAEMIFKGRGIKVKCPHRFLGSECPWYRGVSSLTVGQISFHSLHVERSIMENILHWILEQNCHVLRFFDCTLPGSMSNRFLSRIRKLKPNESPESFPVRVYDVTRDWCLNFTTGRWDKISSEQTLKLLAYNSDCRARCLSQSEAFDDFEDLNESLRNG